MEYFVYIIRSGKDNSNYTGLTANLERRVAEHNKSDTKTTRSKKPWRLIYFEKYSSRIEARKREKYLKSGTGRELRKQLLPD
ncbi:MAG: GIY-YIG nuclease family protein [Candidatus Liptonbacteria bacterium]|nr:GIY-YIG nuclease family protein [Candidatus Liptonbacteria bacterium]